MTSPYPPQPGYPPQGYAPQAPQGYYPPPAPPGYPPQGYAPQGYQPQQQFAAPPGPAPVLARGSLEDWMDQAGGGSPSVTKFFTNERPQGSWLQLQISRDLINSDVQQQTDNNDKPATDKQGRPKFVLIIPCTVLSSSDGSHGGIFTEGTASVWIKGVTKDALMTAMSGAGVQRPDHALINGFLGGASFYMISNGTRAPRNAQYSPTKLYNFTYTPNGRENDAPLAAPPETPKATWAPPDPTQPQSAPMGAPPAPPTGAATPIAAPPAPPQQFAPPAPPQAPPQQFAPPAPPQQFAPPAPPAPAMTPGPAYAAQAAPPPGYEQWAAQQALAQAPQPPQGYAPPAPPQGYAPPQDAEKQALLAKLQGQGG